MIDVLAMILSCSGFALIAVMGKLGFVVSLLGSLLWLTYALQKKSWALCAQSVFFAVFSAVGFLR